jgi:hypothetical protein
VAYLRRNTVFVLGMSAGLCFESEISLVPKLSHRNTYTHSVDERQRFLAWYLYLPMGFKRLQQACFEGAIFHLWYLLLLSATLTSQKPCSKPSILYCLYLPAYFLASTWLIVFCVNDVTIDARQSESSNKLAHTPPRTPPKFAQKWLKSRQL